jgi:hypothetical protein
MAQRKQITTEEIKSMIELNAATQMGDVAEAVFQKKYGDVGKKVDSFDGKINNLLLGVIAGGAFLFISLIIAVIIFMAGMKSSYYQTQDTVNGKINELIQKNAELKIDLGRELDKTQEKQDFLERTFLQKK